MEEVVFDRALTDDEIKNLITDARQEIKSLKLNIEIYKNLLKLNDAGRKEIMIYMFGLTHFKEYRKEVKKE